MVEEEFQGLRRGIEVGQDEDGDDSGVNTTTLGATTTKEEETGTSDGNRRNRV